MNLNEINSHYSVFNEINTISILLKKVLSEKDFLNKLLLWMTVPQMEQKKF